MNLNQTQQTVLTEYLSHLDTDQLWFRGYEEYKKDLETLDSIMKDPTVLNHQQMELIHIIYRCDMLNTEDVWEDEEWYDKSDVLSEIYVICRKTTDY